MYNHETIFSCDGTNFQAQKLFPIASVQICSCMSLRLDSQKNYCFLLVIDISTYHIPPCRMVVMSMVRPYLSTDLTKLEQDFVHGYSHGVVVFYVFTTNKQGKVRDVIEKDIAS